MDHLFTKLSSEGWIEARKKQKQPVYRNEINHVHHILLDGKKATHLTTAVGAFHNLDTFFENILVTYLVNEGFGSSPIPGDTSLWFKISWDNRQLLGKNEAWTITPLHTTMAQCSHHTRDFCIAKTPERAAELKAIVSEIGLNAFLSTFEEKRCMYLGTERSLRFIISTDWMAIVAELGCALPNTKNLDVGVCWCCGVNKKYLRAGWLATPFAYFEPTNTIHKFPTALLPNVPLENRRYNWMHMITNGLTNTVKLIIKEYHPTPSTKQEFDAVIDCCLDARIHKTTYKATSSFVCSEMKAFFACGLHTSLPRLYDKPPLNKLTQYPTPSKFPTLASFATMLEFALDAFRYYYDLAYKQKPTQPEIDHIWHARDRILSLYAGKSWRIAPTLHYLTNEAIHYLLIDHSAYSTLQEGVEHANLDDMVLSTHTLQSAQHFVTGDSSWQAMLNKQTLILEAQKYDLTPPSYSILPGRLQSKFNNNKPLQPLLGLHIQVGLLLFILYCYKNIECSEVIIVLNFDILL